MSPTEWIYENFNTEENEIVWSKYIFTKVDNFVSMFGSTISKALEENKNVVQAIINADKGDSKGFHKYLNEYL